MQGHCTSPARMATADAVLMLDNGAAVDQAFVVWYTLC